MITLEKDIKDFFQSLVPTPVTDWSDLENILVKREIKKGEHFFQNYEKCDEVAIVSKGLFRIYLTDFEGEERTFSFIQERGFILDFFLTWEKSPSMISVQAIEDAEIYVTRYPKLVLIMKKNLIWNEIYREILVRTYMSKTKREIEFVRYNAKERLLKYLEGGSIDLSRIPKTYLASYLGIAPPSLSRLLREIKGSSESSEA